MIQFRHDENLSLEAFQLLFRQRVDRRRPRLGNLNGHIAPAALALVHYTKSPFTQHVRLVEADFAILDLWCLAKLGNCLSLLSCWESEDTFFFHLSFSPRTFPLSLSLPLSSLSLTSCGLGALALGAFLEDKDGSIRKNVAAFLCASLETQDSTYPSLRLPSMVPSFFMTTYAPLWV